MLFDADALAVLDVVPDPCVVITADLVIRHANPAFLSVTARRSSDLLDRHLLDQAFPLQSDDREHRVGRQKLRASIERALANGASDVGDVNRYDLPMVAGGVPVRRYWSPVTSPIRDDHGTIRLLVHRVQEVTFAYHLVDATLGRLSRAQAAAPTNGGVATGKERNLVTEELERLASIWGDRMLIEQAKGMLMAIHGIGSADAFEMLRRESQRTNTKLRHVAAGQVAAAAATWPAQSIPLEGGGPGSVPTGPPNHGRRHGR